MDVLRGLCVWNPVELVYTKTSQSRQTHLSIPQKRLEFSPTFDDFNGFPIRSSVTFWLFAWTEVCGPSWGLVLLSVCPLHLHTGWSVSVFSLFLGRTGWELVFLWALALEATGLKCPRLGPRSWRSEGRLYVTVVSAVFEWRTCKVSFWSGILHSCSSFAVTMIFILTI